MDKVRFGVIGLGNMGSYHCGYLNSVEGACLAAVCDIDRAKMETFSKKHEVPGYEKYEDMLASGKVDAVIIATPHYFHVEMAVAAMAKGLHVLSEKPVSVGVKEGRRVNEVAAKHPELKFGIMFQMRTVPMYKKMRELIADGEVGEISRITWIATDWFRSWAYYASGGWRATWSGEGGGVLINQCPHNLDQLHWITGLMPNRITAVANIAKTHPIEVEDEVSAIMEYPNGAIGHFITTTGEAPGTSRLEIAGDRGRLVAEKGKLIFQRTRVGVQQFNRTTQSHFNAPESWTIEIPVQGGGGEHKIITQNFVRAILKGEALISPGTEGVKGLEIGNAMLLSGLTRKPVDLPVDGEAYEQFIKDLVKKYGGKKTVQSAGGGADFTSSFKGA